MRLGAVGAWGGIALVLSACQVSTLPLKPVSPVVCSTHDVPENVLFLIGDAGEPKLSKLATRTKSAAAGNEAIVDPVLFALAADVHSAVNRVGTDQTGVLYLGDNIYPKGLPPKDHPDRKRAERVLNAQIAAVGGARGFFLPGNHDWERWGPDGWEWLHEQEEYVERFQPRIVLEPSGGCPGPTVVDFGRHLRLIFIDASAINEEGTDLWSEKSTTCSRHNAQEALEDLTVEFRDFDGRQVILATHFPIISGGPHGGHFTLQEHIFPLTDFWPWAWIPLPVIGSVYPLSRAMGVTATDQMNNLYRAYMAELMSTKGPEAPVLVAAGHDHSLQVHRSEGGRFHVVSGAGSASKIDRVMDLDTNLMSVAAPGYMRLDSYPDRGLRLSVTAIDADGRPESIYQLCLVKNT